MLIIPVVSIKILNHSILYFHLLKNQKAFEGLNFLKNKPWEVKMP